MTRDSTTIQTTSSLLMIRPVSFGFNAETAVNNAFQYADDDAGVQAGALDEFNDLVALLRGKGMDVTVINDTPEPHTPDSIFPNNWVSFHRDGTLVLYPMFAVSRRLERKEHVLAAVAARFEIHRVKDLSGFEADSLFLEGTGSMVLDRDSKLAYACLSPRTYRPALDECCRELGYTPVVFDASDSQGHPIYHTNVMMSVAEQYAVICLDVIRDGREMEQVKSTLADSGKLIIPISPDQMNRFAGNMLQVHDAAGRQFLVMSSQAYHSLTSSQLGQLTSFNEIIHSPLDVIEKNGGGSARCMLAEVHLPKKEIERAVRAWNGPRVASVSVGMAAEGTGRIGRARHEGRARPPHEPSWRDPGPRSGRSPRKRRAPRWRTLRRSSGRWPECSLDDHPMI